ncbi:MAG: hypothetical protein M0Z30_00855 [Actinomycetota bacterium]|nr:hypothetical protein [Actinomycetota bacterium]
MDPDLAPVGAHDPVLGAEVDRLAGRYRSRAALERRAIVGVHELPPQPTFELVKRHPGQLHQVLLAADDPGVEAALEDEVDVGRYRLAGVDPVQDGVDQIGVPGHQDVLGPPPAPAPAPARSR